jgi:glycosyltransferase involved in cell wall biosynthesis
MTDRPKIVFLTRSLDIGGAERQIIELAAGLHRTGWDVKVVTFYGGGALETRLNDAGLTSTCLEKGSRWDVLGFGLRLLRLLKREEPHIVHGYLDVPNVVIAALRWLLPRTRIVWGVRASNMDVGATDLLARVESWLGILLSRLPDLIICNSHAGHAHHARRGYFAKRMVVVPNGIDIQRFRPNAEARAELRAEWGITQEQKLVGLVGRLSPMKDHLNFLNAAARIAAQRPDARFVCVGDGPADYREMLERTASGLGLDGALIWAGARLDVWRVYNALDISVSSSSFGEGFSNTIAEAMATGVPCVVTDVGDSANVVGDLGWVCPPNDSDALADSILRALRTLPTDPARIRQRIAANYSSAELLRRTADHLSKLLEPVYTASPARK